jgi:cytoskeletal protein RodZ
MSSFGEEIRRERELREITLREISEATKISMRYLDALERNDFRHLPGGVFNKGFVRAYAQYIGIDPDAMVNAYLLEEQTQQAQKQQRDSARHAPPPDTSAPFRVRIPLSGAWWLALMVALLLVVAAVVVTFLLRGRAADASGSAAPAAPFALVANSGGVWS